MELGVIQWEGRELKPLNHLIEEIKEALKQLKWSDSTLARKSGIRQSTISRILAGETLQPAYNTIECIVQAIEIGIEKLNRRIIDANQFTI